MRPLIFSRDFFRNITDAAWSGKVAAFQRVADRGLKMYTVTPKALANSSPGLECSDNPGYRKKFHSTLKALQTKAAERYATLSALRRYLFA